MRKLKVMFKIKYWGTLASIALLFFTSFTAQASARDDWQYWNEFQVKVHPVKKVALRVKGEQRLRDNFNDLFLANVDAGIFLEPIQYLEFGAAYKFEHEKDSKGDRSDENRLTLEGTIKIPAFSFKLSNRHRAEYRSVEGEEFWRYRTRFKLARPFKIHKNVVLSPYVSEEIFYDGGADQLNQNRIATGLSMRFFKHYDVGLYYLLRSKRSGNDWSEFHILGTSFGLNF